MMLLAAFMTATAWSQEGPTTINLTPEEQQMVSKNNDFAFNLFRKARTEAAAVTTIGIETTSADFADFHASRPFLYIISEQSSGAIFFIGQFTGEGDSKGNPVINDPSGIDGNDQYPIHHMKRIHLFMLIHTQCLRVDHCRIAHNTIMAKHCVSPLSMTCLTSSLSSIPCCSFLVRQLTRRIITSVSNVVQVFLDAQ